MVCQPTAAWTGDHEESSKEGSCHGEAASAAVGIFQRPVVMGRMRESSVVRFPVP